MVETLKSCPFCGGKARLHDYVEIERSGAAFVECEDCAASKKGDFESSESAIAAWNRRPASVSPAIEPVLWALLNPETGSYRTGAFRREEAAVAAASRGSDNYVKLVAAALVPATALQRLAESDAEWGRLHQKVILERAEEIRKREAAEADSQRLAEERDAAREYGKEARLRENAAEEARVHLSFKLTSAEADIAKLREGLTEAASQFRTIHEWLEAKYNRQTVIEIGADISARRIAALLKGGA